MLKGYSPVRILLPVSSLGYFSVSCSTLTRDGRSSGTFGIARPSWVPFDSLSESIVLRDKDAAPDKIASMTGTGSEARSRELDFYLSMSFLTLILFTSSRSRPVILHRNHPSARMVVFKATELSPQIV